METELKKISNSKIDDESTRGQCSESIFDSLIKLYEIRDEIKFLITKYMDEEFKYRVSVIDLENKDDLKQYLSKQYKEDADTKFFADIIVINFLDQGKWVGIPFAIRDKYGNLSEAITEGDLRNKGLYINQKLAQGYSIMSSDEASKKGLLSKFFTLGLQVEACSGMSKFETERHRAAKEFLKLITEQNFLPLSSKYFFKFFDLQNEKQIDNDSSILKFIHLSIDSLLKLSEVDIRNIYDFKTIFKCGLFYSQMLYKVQYETLKNTPDRFGELLKLLLIIVFFDIKFKLVGGKYRGQLINEHVTIMAYKELLENLKMGFKLTNIKLDKEVLKKVLNDELGVIIKLIKFQENISEDINNKIKSLEADIKEFLSSLPEVTRIGVLSVIFNYVKEFLLNLKQGLDNLANV